MTNDLEAFGSADRKPPSVWRLLKRSLDGTTIRIIKSPHEFSKQTPGAAPGVEYLLDEGGLRNTIAGTKATVHEEILKLDQDHLVLAPEVDGVRNGRSTILLAQLGAAAIEDALRSDEKPLVLRGSHDAFDIAGALRVTNGNLGLIVIDTHTDVHSVRTSHSKNPHGMWVSTLLKQSGPPLDVLMENTPALKPENLIHIGIRQLESEERNHIQLVWEKGGEAFTWDGDIFEDGWKPILAAIDELQRRVPVWVEVDEDAKSGANASMPGGALLPRELEALATRIGSNPQLPGMHGVLGIGISEFQAPNPDADENDFEAYEHRMRALRNAQNLRSVVHRMFGAGFSETGMDIEPEVPKKRVDSHSRTRDPLLRRVFDVVAGAAAGIGAIIAGKAHLDERQKAPDAPDRAMASRDIGQEGQSSRIPHVNQSTSDFLRSFSDSGFRELARRLRFDDDNGDDRHAKDILRRLAEHYLAAQKLAPNQDAECYLGDMALSEFAQGYGVLDHRSYNRFLQTVEERRKRMEKNG